MRLELVAMWNRRAKSTARGPMRVYVAALVLLVLTVLAAPAAWSQTQTGDPVEPRFRVGMEAIAAASQAAGEDARDEHLDRAIASFRSILVDRPELVRVRLELGRAFFLKGEDTLARRHFEQVLAGKPPAAVALNVNRFLSAMRARKRWSVRVGVALAPDTNLGAASGDDTIWIPVGDQRLPFALDQPAEEDSGIGLMAWAGGEYQYPLDRQWRLRAGVDVSRREYRSDTFDRMTVAGHLGPRWLVDRNTETSLLGVVRQDWLANDPEFRDVGVRVETRHRLSRRTVATLRVSHHERRYEERTHLDGPVTDVSLTTSWVAGPTVRVDAGIGWSREKPETERYRNKGRWLRAGATVALPLGFTVGGSGTLRWADYEGNWFPFTDAGSSRSDITRSLRINAYNRAFTVGGFSPQVSLVREDRTSDAQLHDYERTSGELRFVRLF